MRISLMTTLMASALALGTAANAQTSQTQQPPPGQEQPPQMQEQQQPPSGQQQSQAEGPDVQVQQAPADVQVQQQPPEVIVKQPQPEVTIQQPEPQVTVEQGKPDVNIEQAKPNVEVTQEGEPKVQIQEQAQSPDQQSQPPQDQQSEAQEAQTGAATTPPPESTAQTAGLNQIMDKDVYGQGGEQVGTVSDVLVDNQGQPQMVIIEHGGFLGIGQREVAFEMSQVQMQGEQVQIPVTQDQLKEMPEWSEDQVASSGYTSQRTSEQPPAQTGATTTTTTTQPAQPTTD